MEVTTITTRRLFDISDDLQALEDKLFELGGDVTDEDVEAALDSWFDTLITERDQKLDSYAALITELTARARARKAEADRIATRAKVDMQAADRLKGRLLFFFRQHDLKTVETLRYRLTRANAGGKQSIDLKSSVDQLPPSYVKTEVVKSPDMDKIRQDLESGKVLEFAELKERSEYLKIS